MKEFNRILILKGTMIIVVVDNDNVDYNSYSCWKINQHRWSIHQRVHLNGSTEDWYLCSQQWSSFSLIILSLLAASFCFDVPTCILNKMTIYTWKLKVAVKLSLGHSRLYFHKPLGSTLPFIIIATFL